MKALWRVEMTIWSRPAADSIEGVGNGYMGCFEGWRFPALLTFNPTPSFVFVPLFIRSRIKDHWRVIPFWYWHSMGLGAMNRDHLDLLRIRFHDTTSCDGGRATLGGLRGGISCPWHNSGVPSVCRYERKDVMPIPSSYLNRIMKVNRTLDIQSSKHLLCDHTIRPINQSQAEGFPATQASEARHHWGRWRGWLWLKIAYSCKQLQIDAHLWLCAYTGETTTLLCIWRTIDSVCVLVVLVIVLYIWQGCYQS
jgi:hypothetical protein